MEHRRAIENRHRNRKTESRDSERTSERGARASCAALRVPLGGRRRGGSDRRATSGGNLAQQHPAVLRRARWRGRRSRSGGGRRGRWQRGGGSGRSGRPRHEGERAAVLARPAIGRGGQPAGCVRPCSGLRCGRRWRCGRGGRRCGVDRGMGGGGRARLRGVGVGCGQRRRLRGHAGHGPRGDDDGGGRRRCGRGGRRGREHSAADHHQLLLLLRNVRRRGGGGARRGRRRRDRRCSGGSRSACSGSGPRLAARAMAMTRAGCRRGRRGHGPHGAMALRS